MSISTDFSVPVAPSEDAQASALSLEVVNNDTRNQPCVCRVRINAQDYSVRPDPYRVSATLVQRGQHLIAGYANGNIKLESILEEGVRVHVDRLGKRDKTLTETVRFNGTQRQSVRYAEMAKKVRVIKDSKFRDVTGGVMHLPLNIGNGEFEAAKPTYGVLVVQYEVKQQLFALTYSSDTPVVQFNVVASEPTRMGYEVFEEQTGKLVDWGDTVPGSSFGGGTQSVPQIHLRQGVIPQVELFAYTSDAANTLGFSPEVQVFNESSTESPRATAYERRVRRKVQSNDNPNMYAEIDLVTDRTEVDPMGQVSHTRYSQ